MSSSSSNQFTDTSSSQTQESDGKQFQSAQGQVVATSNVSVVIHEATERAADFKSWTPDQESKILILATSRRLAMFAPFTPSDQADLFQELLHAWFQNHLRHDATRGPLWAFRKALIKHTSCRLLRNARAGKRWCRSQTSLEQADTSEGSIRRLDPHQDRRRILGGQSPLTHEQHSDLKADMESVINTLDPDDAKLCEQLKLFSLAEISRETGIPQPTLSSRLSRVRRRSECQRLKKYL